MGLCVIEASDAHTRKVADRRWTGGRAMFELATQFLSSHVQARIKSTLGEALFFFQRDFSYDVVIASIFDATASVDKVDLAALAFFTDAVDQLPFATGDIGARVKTNSHPRVIGDEDTCGADPLYPVTDVVGCAFDDRDKGTVTGIATTVSSTTSTEHLLAS